MTRHRILIRLKRVYEPRSDDDGLRILVERLWPRGLTKEKAAIDLWPKELSPSPELRKWYGHDPAKWDEFRARYRTELDRERDALAELKAKIGAGPVTLVYAARDEERNSAVVLKQCLEEPR